MMQVSTLSERNFDDKLRKKGVPHACYTANFEKPQRIISTDFTECL